MRRERLGEAERKPERGVVPGEGFLEIPTHRERLATLDSDALISRMKRALAEVGVVVVRCEATQAQFFAVARRLGIVLTELAVFVEPRQVPYVRNAGVVPFHTDHHPLADIIGWYCVQPCRSGTPSVYLDAEDAYDRMSPADQDKLQRIRLRVKSAKGRELVPVVTFDGSRPRFAWNSLWLHKPIEPDAQGAVRRFSTMLATPGRAHTVTVPLAAGEFVFIDNKRFLHGRDAIPPDSRRLLYRLWISSDARAASFDLTKPTPMRVLKRRRPPAL
jgi:alpha-ketoglutarate-dependent taurine dioxygenase